MLENDGLIKDWSGVLVVWLGRLLCLYYRRRHLDLGVIIAVSNSDVVSHVSERNTVSHGF